MSSGIHHFAILPSRKAKIEFRVAGATAAVTDHEQGTFFPLRMRNPDHRGLGYAGSTHDEVSTSIELYPFPARLDHVLCPIRELNVVIVVDRGKVAGIEPSILEQSLLVAKIA